MASDAVPSKAVILLLFVFCLLLLSFGVGVVCGGSWCCVLISYHLARNRELHDCFTVIVLCLCSVSLPHGAVGWSAVNERMFPYLPMGGNKSI